MNVVVDSNRNIKDRIGYEIGCSILTHAQNELLKRVCKLLNLLSEGDMLTLNQIYRLEFELITCTELRDHD